jgi:hypothetical protein
MTKKTPPSIGQFALSERDDLLSTIAEQAREISKLESGIPRLNEQLYHAKQELAALKAQPGAVVLPDILFDGFTVYEEVLKGREQQRTSHENVSDTLDAIARLLRRANPDSARLNASRVPVEPAHREGVTLAHTRTGRVYIAGPMTGYDNYNFAAFNAEAAMLRDQGLHVENPADHGVLSGADWADYLRYDIARLASCERVQLLPGWSKSKGASLEVHIARALGMPITYPGAAESHSDVSVPRELLELIDEAMCDFLGQDDPLRGQLRALLAGGEV